MPTRPGTVIIVGAGPAGMALAYLLSRRGIEVTVLESHRDFARSFRGEGLQRSGIDAIRQMGLGDQLDRIPYVEVDTVEIHQGGNLRVRANPADLGRAQARLVSQPALLQMFANEAALRGCFRLELGVTMRDFLYEGDRIVGVQATVGSERREYRADLVIGSDGRHAATRKHCGLEEHAIPQHYDVLWLKLPMPLDYPHRTGIFELAFDRVSVAFPTADGQLQIGFVIPKGGFAKLRALGADVWTEAIIGRLPAYLADHLRLHRDAVARTTLLSVVCGCLTQWTRPGLLLIGDAAHPMSPVGGQGVNLALRDALVAANQLCPVLLEGCDLHAIDVAAIRVMHERMPEILAAQRMQTEQAKLFFAPHDWSTRLMHRMLPLLVRSGVLPWLHRKQYQQMSNGFVPVKLTA